MTLREAAEALRAAGIDYPEYDARDLFRAFGGVSGIIMQNTECNSRELEAALARRIAREPLQYIIGNVEFYREKYRVTPECLIPRPDTEILVEYAVRQIPEGECFADLCCGSGCVGISTLNNTRSTRCVSYDVSRGAISLTLENAKRNRVDDRLTAIEKDLLKEDIDGEYFAILSNPPYIPRKVYEGLEKEIFHEPEIALVGGESGLIFYERLIPVSLKHLKEGGFIAFEIGYDQAEAISELAERHGLWCEITKDYSANDRVAVLRRK